MIYDDEEEIFHQKVLEARAMSPSEKLMAGPRMFDRWCELMREAIRLEFPTAGPSRVNDILRWRIELIHGYEKNPITHPETPVTDLLP